MNWQQYEQYCVSWWNIKNTNQHARLSKRGPNGEDGGVDMVIETPEGVMLGQCKHYWGDKFVTVGIVKELFADMQHHKIKQGIIFTSGLFSKKALEYAKKSNIWIERLEDPDIKKFEKRKEREEVKKRSTKTT